MLYIVVALKSEANILIKDLKLQKNLDENFPIFENDFIKLIISGIGSINSAIATTYLLNTYKASKEDKAINIGICGAKDKDKIGKLFSVHKIIDTTTYKVYHLQKDENSLAISTYSKPLTNKSILKTPLVDMESSGFYLSCSKFIKKNNIMIKKIVSDNLEDDIRDRDFIDTLFNKHIKKINEECISYRS
jgi:purine-nucleoside phosphorylase